MMTAGAPLNLIASTQSLTTRGANVMSESTNNK
jgi:hypothetical protein